MKLSLQKKREEKERKDREKSKAPFEKRGRS